MKIKQLAIYTLLAATLTANSISFAQTTENIFQNNGAYRSSGLIQADIESRRIPAGSVFKIRIETPVNSYNSNSGDQYTATIIEDLKVDNNVVLPAGTILRGTVASLKRSKMLSRSAEMGLAFDHIVTPVGKQISIAASLTGMDNLTYEGTMKAKGNYFTRSKENFSHSTGIVKEATRLGIDTGRSFWSGYPMYVTTPLAATGGFFVGTADFVIQSTVDLFKKGNDVVLSPGQTLNVYLNQPLDIPLN